MKFCSLCAYYHIKYKNSVVCYYPNYTKPRGNAMRLVVRHMCPIYQMKGVDEKSSSEIQYVVANSENTRGDRDDPPKKIWGYCPDCNKPLLREHSRRCTLCSQKAYKKEWARRKNGKF